MKRILHTAAAACIGIALLALVGVPGAMAQDKQGKCFLAGGEATMVTGDLARFMANAALANSIKGANARSSGAVKTTCKDGIASVHCLAQQRACR